MFFDHLQILAKTNFDPNCVFARFCLVEVLIEEIMMYKLKDMSV